jgi:putative chitinase
LILLQRLQNRKSLLRWQGKSQSEPTEMQVTPDILRALGVRADLADTWAVPISTACARHAINTQRRVAAFLATVLHETGGLTGTVENLNYTPERLMQVWPSHFGPSNAYRLGRTADHPADQEMIADLAYGGRLGNGAPGTGDGWTYRGRGLIQLTGKANYQAFATKIGVPVTDLPTLLQMPSGAAESAAAYWEGALCNVLADRGDVAGVRRAVNGGEIGLEDVQARYAAALKVLPSDSAPLPAPPAAPAAPAAPPAKPGLLAGFLALFHRS